MCDEVAEVQLVADLYSSKFYSCEEARVATTSIRVTPNKKFEAMLRLDHMVSIFQCLIAIEFHYDSVVVLYFNILVSTFRSVRSVAYLVLSYKYSFLKLPVIDEFLLYVLMLYIFSISTPVI